MYKLSASVVSRNILFCRLVCDVGSDPNVVASPTPRLCESAGGGGGKKADVIGSFPAARPVPLGGGGSSPTHLTPVSGSDAAAGGCIACVHSGERASCTHFRLSCLPCYQSPLTDVLEMSPLQFPPQEVKCHPGLSPSTAQTPAPQSRPLIIQIAV